ncbi:bifunctional DNA primase/polymerase [Lentzea flaviverrucosa]|uniref:Bifunctional DNA primase/polymerase, N-terminal n=1 Tax=Lentzea flaviverrucosa TaxID=200379 RepID=A0A1H9XQ13_9PSEU|nr:bifunctional DNA primase/polymerase [Lentzea flaviverrucosa]RDI19670.1 bifunctional DNA primase/polymerase-like protein [Lentzea flaviverrucosa]SES47773.1 Bifunctional DNA primase/polymerase, N-terminal [Lentzea flaviverrucosa]
MSAALVAPGNERLGAALDYAARGWRVVPLHHVSDHGMCSCGRECGSEGKHPRLSQWQITATTDANQITAWWAATPSTGVGLATGPESDLFVLDIDPDHGGDATLTALERTYGPLPITRTVITGSGGTHYCFKWPERVRRDGREWRNSAGKLGPGLDTRGAGGQVVAPPSVSAKGAYAVAVDAPLADVPEWVLDLLDAPVPLPAEVPQAGATVTRLPIAAGDDRVAAYVHAVVTAECNAIVTAPDGTQNNAINSAAFALGQLVAVGALTETEAENALTDAARQGNHPADRAASAIRSGLGAGVQVPRTPWPPQDRENLNGFRVTPVEIAAYAAINGTTEDEAREFFGVTSSTDETDAAGITVVPVGDPAELRCELVTALRKWLHVNDFAPFWIALGAAVTAVDDDDQEPVWIQVVGASSSGKTEVVRLLKGVQVEQLDEITPGGLLTWGKIGKVPKPTGLLSRVKHGIVTFSDFSTLLAGAQRGGKDETFALLRRVFDGEVTRDVQAPGGNAPGQLHWKGRLTIISAVTGEIDRQLAFHQALGERWLYVRVPDASRTDQRAAARKARDRHNGARADAEQLATRFVLSGQAAYHEVELSDHVLDAIEDADQVARLGRASVPRSSVGKMEIIGEASVEGAGRLLKQLAGLARGLTALGFTEDEVTTLARRAALDSMPAKRHRVLAGLAAVAWDGTDKGHAGSTRLAPLAREIGLDRRVVRRVLEEFAVIEDGVVEAVSESNEFEIDSGTWRLAPDYAEDLRRVLLAPVRITA